MDVAVAAVPELTRHGLVLLLREQGLGVVGAAADVSQALTLVRAHRPAVVLTRVRLPGGGALALLDQLSGQALATRVLLLSAAADDAQVVAAIGKGAAGVIRTDATVAELVEAMRLVAAGGSLVPPEVAARLVSEVARPREDGLSGRLTRRELEVLRLVARGWHNRDVAEELEISENTVKNHVRHILEKLQLGSRVEAATYAVRERLVEPGP